MTSPVAWNPNTHAWEVVDSGNGNNYMTWFNDPDLPNSRVFGASFCMFGLESARPSPGAYGALYFATDTGNIWRDSTVGWDKMGVLTPP